MSKAFTREDDARETMTLKRPVSNLPPGIKNYFTSAGIEKLRQELEQLNAQAESAANRQRILEIQHSLQTAVPVPPPPQPWDQILFGATITVINQFGEETNYRIVGADETDIDRDWISWLSPLAKALFKKRLGEEVQFRAPAGLQMLQIKSIRYE